MSGLYHVIFGTNKLAGPLMVALKIEYRSVERFRDCFLGEDDTIIVYTRTGGNNRADYAETNEKLRQVEGYLRDEDDAFDSTYALFHYKIPDGIRELCDALKKSGHAVNPAKRWADTLTDMEKGRK